MPTSNARQHRPSPIERAIVLALGVVLVGAMLYIVLGNVSVSDRNYPVLRLLLALTAAIMGAFLPGALMDVTGDIRGLSLRAGGAAGFFVLVFLLSGSIPREPPLALLAPASPDLRSLYAHDDKAHDYLAAPVVLVLPVGFLQDDRSPEVHITAMSATVDYGQMLAFTPNFVTELVPGAQDGWLPNPGGTALTMPITYDAGMNAEIAFSPAGSTIRWGEFLKILASPDIGQLRIVLTADTDKGHVAVACSVNFPPWSRRIREAKTPPDRLSMRC